MRQAGIALLVGLLLMIPSRARAQAPGDRTEVLHPLVFELMNDHITLDPNANVTPASRIEFTRGINDGLITKPSMGVDLLIDILEGVGVSIPGWVVDLLDGLDGFSNVSIKPSVGPFFNADYGGYFQVQPASQEGVTLKAAINVVTNAPAMNTFKCGDEISIVTSSQGGSNASLKVKPSTYDYQIGPVFKNIEFGANVGVDIHACFGVMIDGTCIGDDEKFSPSHKFGISVPLPSFLNPIPPLVNVCRAAFQPGANESTLLSCSTGLPTPLFQLWQGNLNLLNSALGTQYSFADFSTQGQVKLVVPDLPSVPGLPTLPQAEAVFRQPTEVATFGAATDGSMVAADTQNDISTASLDLVSLLDFVGITTSVSLGGGFGGIDLGDIAPIFHVDQHMRYEFKPSVSESMTLAAPMAFKVIDPVFGQVAAGTGTVINFKPGQTITLSFPSARKNPVSVTNTYGMNGTMSTRTAQQYRLSVNFKALHITGPGGFDFSALDKDIDLSGSVLPEHVIENNTINLPAFTPVTLPGLTLDPEDPRIDVTEHSLRDTLNIGNGERAVVYRTSVANSGDVSVRDAALNLDLASIFGGASAFQAVCVASSDLPLNPSYNGISSASLLAPGTSLDPGQQGTVDVLVRVTPEVARINANGCFTPVAYTSSSFATGKSPIGTPIRSSYDQCAGMSTGPDLTTTADLGASRITKVSDFAIYASDALIFDGATGTSYGNAGAGSTIQFRKSGGDQPLRLVGDVHTGNDLQINQSQLLADYVQVHDRVRIDKKSSLVVNGRLSEASDCAAGFELASLDFVKSGAGAPRIAVADGASVTLGAGDYRSIQVRNHSTVTLRPGIYNIDDLVISGDGASFVFDVSGGTITLNIGSWKNGNSQGLKFLAPAGASRAVRINYAANGLLSFRNAVLQGTLVAPDAAVSFDEGSQMLGSLRAKRITFGAGSTFVDHHHLEPLKIDPRCATALQSPTVPVIVGR